MKQGEKAGKIKQKSQILFVSMNKTYFDQAHASQKESRRCQAWRRYPNREAQ